MLICRALIKYGHSSFKLEILEYCAPEDLEDRENYYIDSVNPEYNVVQKSNAMPSRVGYKHRKSTIEKISKAQPASVTISVLDLLTNTEKVYDSLSQAEIELNITRSRLSWFLSKGEARPIDKRYIITKLQKTYVKSVKVVESWRIGIQIEVLDLETNTTTVYSTIRSAARATGLVHSTIRKYLTLGVPTIINISLLIVSLVHLIKTSIMAQTLVNVQQE